MDLLLASFYNSFQGENSSPNLIFEMFVLDIGFDRTKGLNGSIYIQFLMNSTGCVKSYLAGAPVCVCV